MYISLVISEKSETTLAPQKTVKPVIHTVVEGRWHLFLNLKCCKRPTATISLLVVYSILVLGKDAIAISFIISLTKESLKVAEFYLSDP